MGELFYVFSDETGHWNNEGFYIRSWVLLSEEEYFKLENRIKLFKKINDKESELKYKPSSDYSLFCDLDFKVYFTLTFSDDFRERNFELITNVETQENPSFEINNKNIRDKVINTLKNSIFLNIYEYYHISNALKYFKEDCINKNIIFMVDSPQCQNPDWRKIFEEHNESDFVLNIIKDSKDESGVQFADILAGNFNKIVKNVGSNSPLNLFEKKIVSNLSFGNGSTGRIFLNNPQIIMWDEDKHQDFINKLGELKKQNEN